MRRWVITGASGGLGRAVMAALPEQVEVSCLDRSHGVDLVAETGPLVCAARGAQVLLHLAGTADIDACERDPEAALRLHAGALGALEELPRGSRPFVVMMSTNDVFSGRPAHRAPFPEEEPAAPTNAYTRSKVAGEEVALALGGSVVRATFLSPECKPKVPFLSFVLDSLRKGRTIRCYTDVVSGPVHRKTLAEALVRCALERRQGPVHVGCLPGVSRYELARELARQAGLDQHLIVPVRLADNNPGRRPLEASLLPSPGFFGDLSREVALSIADHRASLGMPATGTSVPRRGAMAGYHEGMSDDKKPKPEPGTQEEIVLDEMEWENAKKESEEEED